MDKIKAILKNPLITLGLVMLASITALSAAFIGEHIFNLKPCNLCVYQRYPFAIGIILGFIGVILYKHKAIARALLAVLGVNFLINSAIAFYHTGVELKWWASILEGCTVPILDKDKTILESIMGASITSCTDIQWVDPVIGLSMANYNIAFCFGLFVFCVASAVMIKK